MTARKTRQADEPGKGRERGGGNRVLASSARWRCGRCSSEDCRSRPREGGGNPDRHSPTKVTAGPTITSMDVLRKRQNSYFCELIVSFEFIHLHMSFVALFQSFDHRSNLVRGNIITRRLVAYLLLYYHVFMLIYL